MPGNNPVRQVALAGCGAIAPMHVRGLVSCPGIELTALVDPQPEAAEEIARSWYRMKQVKPGCYTSLAELLSCCKPDVIHICTPHHTHVPLAVQALDAGCSVLLEKPPAVNTGELRELEAKQQESGINIGLCFQNRFNPSSLSAWQLMRSGIPGSVSGARAFVTWWRDSSYYTRNEWRGRWLTEGGGVLINQAIHELDLMFWLAGRPCQVEGSWSNHHLKTQIEVEDTAEAWFELENGAPALFYATSAYPRDAATFLEISCRNMILRLEADRLIIFDHQGRKLDRKDQDSILTEASRMLATKAYTCPADALWADIFHRQNQLDAELSLAELGKSCWGISHIRLIRAFYQALEKDRKATTFPLAGKTATTAIKAVLGIYRSHREKKMIQL